MTKQKKKENRIIFLFFTFIFLSLSIASVNADISKCKKFDIKCKTKKFVDDTKSFQKIKLQEGKNQLKDSKEKILKGLPKSN